MGTVPGKKKPRLHRAMLDGGFRRLRRVDDDNGGVVNEDGLVERKMEPIIGEMMPCQPSLGRRSHLGQTVARDDD